MTAWVLAHGHTMFFVTQVAMCLYLIFNREENVWVRHWQRFFGFVCLSCHCLMFPSFVAIRGGF